MTMISALTLTSILMFRTTASAHLRLVTSQPNASCEVVLKDPLSVAQFNPDARTASLIADPDARALVETTSAGRALLIHRNARTLEELLSNVSLGPRADAWVTLRRLTLAVNEVRRRDRSRREL